MQFHHLPQRINLVVLRFDRDKPGVAFVADVHRFNRSGGIRQVLPDADTRQMGHGALRQRNGAGVKTGMGGAGRRCSLNQMHRQFALR